MSLKRLIINADDFGLDEAVNRGIELAFKEGILTSTTLLPNGPAFEDALARAKATPSLKIGIHLNVLRGSPVSDKATVKSLLDKKGFFLQDIRRLVLRMVGQKIRAVDLERELRAQIEKVLKQGLEITHIDSEKHLHCLPLLLKIIVKLAKEYQINKMRLVKERVIDYPDGRLGLQGLFKTQYYKVLILNRLAERNRGFLDTNQIGYPDEFFGVFYSGLMTKDKYKKIFYSLNSGVTEIMCHAGYNIPRKDSPDSFGKFYLNTRREEELEALLDPELKSLLNQMHVELINYGGIN